MKALRILLVVLLVGIVGAAIYVGLRGESGDVVIGGKNFTEQTILGEMAAQLIEHHTDLTVRRQFNLAANMPMGMLKSGEIDLYPDYTGTGYSDILGKEYKAQSADEIYQYVSGVYPEKFDAQWLSPLGFANSYTLTMRGEHAEELGIEKISDLASHTDLDAGFDPSFIERADGYPGIVETYGFRFDSPPQQLKAGIMYRALRNGQVDVINAFSTDGRIERFNLRILDDDRNFFPPYDAAFVVRNDLVEKYPQVKAVLEKLSGKIDTQTMQKLNYAVDEQQRNPADVAREFLVSHALLSGGDKPATRPK